MPPLKIVFVFFKKMGQPGPLFVYFGSFQTNIITIFTTDQCEKMSCPSSIRRRDLNPQPLDHEPPPITTRPGLLPLKISFRFTKICFCYNR